MTKPTTKYEQAQLNRFYSNYKSQENALFPEALLRIETLNPKDRQVLFTDLNRIHSFDVCKVIGAIENQGCWIETEKNQLLDQYNALETQKEVIISEFRTKNAGLIQEKEECMDVNREREFELIMLDEQNVRAV